MEIVSGGRHRCCLHRRRGHGRLRSGPQGSSLQKLTGYTIIPTSRCTCASCAAMPAVAETYFVIITLVAVVVAAASLPLGSAEICCLGHCRAYQSNQRSGELVLLVELWRFFFRERPPTPPQRAHQRPQMETIQNLGHTSKVQRHVVQGFMCMSL